MLPKDVYNMDEIAIFYCTQPNKTPAQGKHCGCKIQKVRLTLALVVNTTGTYKFETYDYLQVFMPKMLWKVVANKLYVVVCKPNGMDDIICI